jgi:hypothetical protein
LKKKGKKKGKGEETCCPTQTLEEKGRLQRLVFAFPKKNRRMMNKKGGNKGESKKRIVFWGLSIGPTKAAGCLSSEPSYSA